MKIDINTISDYIVTNIKKVIRELLEDKSDDINLEKSFLELGINSVLSVELVEKLNQKFEIDLGIEVIFDNNNVKELAKHIENQYGKKFQITGSTKKSTIAYQFNIKKNNFEKKDQKKPRRIKKNKIPTHPNNGTNNRQIPIKRILETNIAIIGISGKFAGSETIEKFWEHLRTGESCIEEIKREGWEESNYYSPDASQKNKSISKWGGLLDNISDFDPLFFNISSQEAERMDPQQRLFMEEAYKAFEDAGYSAEALSGKKIGVFIGGRNSDYKNKTLNAEISAQTFLGSELSILAARISYFLNLKGPSIALDTACSSSLVAIHLACKSILNSESDMALAGGVFVMNSPEFFIMASKTNMLSPDGKCRTFDNNANGMVVGEGTGALVLKRLDLAIAERDHIYGIIKGSAVNQDGRTNGITAPSMLSQKELIHEAYNNSSVNPESVSYIEAHGTGTKLGDPIEFKALTEAFRMFTGKRQYCAIGSHKPNIGHTVMTAGIAGVFKILMAMKYRMIPPTIGIDKFNEHLNLEESPFFINTKLEEWKNSEGPVIAGINSFGSNGTNCHLIIEEPPARIDIADNSIRPYYLFPFSAKTKTALNKKLIDIAEWLEKEAGSHPVEDISYTLCKGRSHFKYRCIFIVKDAPGLKDCIREISRNGISDNYYTNIDEVNYNPRNEEISIESEEYVRRLIGELNDANNFTPETYKEKLTLLSGFFIKGYNLNWDELFNSTNYYRVSLPTYPFDNENYWILKESETDIRENNTLISAIPLSLQRSASGQRELCFSSTFLNNDFSLSDHIVNNHKILPGVIYLEMARAAFETAINNSMINAAINEDLNNNRKIIQLKDIVWIKPVVAGDNSIQLYTGLYPEPDGNTFYKIYSKPENKDADAVLFNQGKARLVSFKDLPLLNIQLIRNQYMRTSLNSYQCYEIFRKMGIEYGRAYQGIEMIYMGIDRSLAKLSVPASISGAVAQFVLHPYLMDSALQAAVILALRDKEFSDSNASFIKPLLAFSLKDMVIYNNCSDVTWAFIQSSEESNKTNIKSTNPTQTKRFDIDLCDNQGRICVHMNGFSFREIEDRSDSKYINSNQKGYMKNLQLDAPTDKMEGGLIIQEMEELLLKLLWYQLRSMGLFKEDATISELKNMIGLSAAYDRWLKESINIFVKNGYLKYDEEIISAIEAKDVDISIVWDEWDKKKFVWLQNPNTKVHVNLVESTLRALPRIIIGKVLATDIMFPNSSMELVEGIYKNNQIADYFNDVLTDVLLVYIQEYLKKKPSNRIRILEIGAGTGGTSSAIFKKIKPYIESIEEYCFSDISKAFLIYAQKEYGNENPYLTYKIYNVEVGSTEQAIKSHEYNVVIATNTLHATKNIKRTLKNIRETLKEDGLLLLNELSSNSLFTHLTFGLLGGWWLYEDEALRIPGCPGLYPGTWAEVLKDEGFSSVFFPVEKAHKLGQQIIVAECDGAVQENREFVKYNSITGHAADQGPEPAKYNALEQSDRINEHISVDIQGNGLKDIDLNDHIVEDFIKSIIKKEIANELNIEIDIIDNNLPFRDYGVDSIIGVKLVQSINQILKIELDTISLFDYSSINQITKYILDNHKKAIVSSFKYSSGIKNKDSKEISEVYPPNASLPKSVFAELTHNYFENSPIINIDPKGKQSGIYSEKILSTSSANRKENDSVAIIGMSGRFSKSKTVDDLWAHLTNGDDLIEEVTRWDLSKYFQGESDYCNYGSFLEDIDKFDPLFFNISGIEATYMDPQQRIFLEESWKALEDAGYPDTGKKKQLCGVYVGCRRGDYQLLFGDDSPAQAFWGNEGSLIPARIAYYLDLHGPAIAVDTACSSSLVAIYLACKSILSEEIDMALAGGVFVQSSPEFYLMGNRAGMLSLTRCCHTFDREADGFVPGEGAGVVVLKSEKKAISDGDHIYGVIRGLGINQDGTTNGITAPSANSQERLECEVYDSFNINPEQIQMVEAHGTGTKLGDPIEYQALTRAFRKYTNKKEYCAIGSIKTNLGHLATAAGMAGFIKILLSLQHKQIPPTLHFNKGNQNIQFKDSPFYVNTTLRDWNIEAGSKRLAVISSFGFSGTNAHIVVEEAEEAKLFHSKKPGYLIVLSARTKEQLRQQVEQLANYCEAVSGLDCDDISYTLLLGRKHFNHRLACIINSKDELVTQLKKWIEKGKASQVYVSELNENDHREQPSLKRYGNQCIHNFKNSSNASEFLENLSAIAELFIQGYELGYEQLFSDEQYTRISLPTYPFARERYWVAEAENISLAANSSLTVTANIHPLLHENTSDLIEQRFSSRFTGKEFFLRDHKINGVNILPGVVYLEMARAAVEKATGSIEGIEEEFKGIKLKNIVWIQPIAVNGEGTEVHIGIYAEENGEITYEIYSEREGEEIVHSQGRAILCSAGEIPKIDLAGMQIYSENIIEAGSCYEVFNNMGQQYGPGHRAIKELYADKDIAIAKLTIPESVAETEKDYVLHPSIMDGALQTYIGLRIANGDANDANNKPVIAFALEEVEVYDKCKRNMWVLVKRSEGCKIEDKVQKLDIDICEESGRVCVRLKKFTSRVMEGDSTGTLLLEEIWEEKATVTNKEIIPDYDKHTIILIEPADGFKEAVEREIGGAGIITLKSDALNIAQRCENYAMQLFEEVQKILRDKPKGKVLIQLVIRNNNDNKMFFKALSGVLNTAEIENPNIIGQLIEFVAEENENAIEKLRESSRESDKYIRYENNKRFIKSLREFNSLSSEGTGIRNKEISEIPWKKRGLYLITGGSGGIGLLLAREIVKKASDVKVILTGRSSLSKIKEDKLKELETHGRHVKYMQVDVRNKEAVIKLIQELKEKYGSINGIIHIAGVIKDNYIIKKTTNEFQEVLSPKMSGLVNLDESSKDILLDFFICFSSIAATFGNTGQADYSTANAFMDRYAGYRNKLVSANKRSGRTISINWPLWKEGGMQIDEESEKIWQSKGMRAMETETGIKALYKALSSGKDHVIVLEGNIKLLKSELIKKQVSEEESGNVEAVKREKAIPVIAEDILKDKAVNYFKKLLSSVIKLPAQRIDADAPMEKYGIDSIMVTRLTNKLEKTFGSLSKTLFFEYQNINALTDYFLESYRYKITGLLGIEGRDEADIEDSWSTVEKKNTKHTRRIRRGKRLVKRDEGNRGKETISMDIAIIGVSGRYPQAKNIREFWENLRNGRDCIIEIPKERWNHELYYDVNKDKFGKTYSKWGGFIDDIDKFDPLFFNISPREAEFMDPQERIFLECVYETLEDAGYTKEELGKYGNSGSEGAVGVYVGVMYEEYQLYGAQEQIQGRTFALGGSISSVANRVSYYCNFHGPSLGIDTMCSSSLTAIHLACQSISQGECEMAIAGGVNITIHPNKYFVLAQGKFASSKGRCESFGEGGDGYVPGEGVGAVLLKPLSKAVADNDHIYGVIKGTAVNHGGKTNGYSVPNPNAQTRVIAQAIKQAKVDPRTISYIEAHGTGTSLGDPIEITGLTKAFQKYTEEKGFCAIGSAKSNIGHLESAAGIAAVTKVLLQFKYCTLVPSLHSGVLNPNIDFKSTPFTVQRELSEWKRPVMEINGEKKEYPRIAGISSFGAGGANAHVIIEEYFPRIEEQELTVNSQSPAIIVLSAKNEAQLKEQAKHLLKFIHEQKFTDNNLADMAYTLQVGREPMEERLGMIVSSVKELEEKLSNFEEGKEDADELYKGQVKRNKDTMAIFTADEDMARTVEAWISKRKYGKLLDLWVKGLVLDWNKIYGDIKPRRISLPTYPFARERYWVPEISGRAVDIAGRNIIEGLHPMIDINESTLDEEIFKKTLKTEEFFLKDHLVKNQIILPGVAYLEMARAAGELAGKKKINFIKDVIWIRPILLNDEEKKDIYISLHPEKDSVVYEVHSRKDDERVIYSKGKLGYSTEISFNERQQKRKQFNLEEIKKRCIERKQKEEIYQHYKSIGYNYGPSFQVTQEIHYNESEVMARLCLPEGVRSALSDYMLHPSLMDGALRALIWLGVEEGLKNPVPHVPFALGQLEIIGRMEEICYSYICRSQENSDTRSGITKFNISILNEAGEELVIIKDFTGRPFKDQSQHAINDKHLKSDGILYYKPVWEKKILPDKNDEKTGSRPLADKFDTIIIFDRDEEVCKELISLMNVTPEQFILIKPGNIYKKLNAYHYQINPGSSENYQRLFHELKKKNITPTHIIHMWNIQRNADNNNSTYPEISNTNLDFGLYSMLYLFQSITASVIETKTRCAFVFGGSKEVIHPEYESISAFAKSLTTVNHRFELLSLQLYLNEFQADRLSSILVNELTFGGNLNGAEIRYINDLRFVKVIQTVTASDKEFNSGIIPLKTKGIYLITGGMGGIGNIFSGYLAEKYQAGIILIGRSELNGKKEQDIERLKSKGSEVIYVQADVSKKDDVEKLIQIIKEKFQALNGIIHMAGVEALTPVIQVEKSGFEEALLPKIQGTINLDIATKDEKLDFFIMFSSISALVGDFGTCSYAVANGFMDSYALLRENLSLDGKRTGRTLSINWPLWKDGGMKMPEEGSFYYQYSGMEVITNEVGINAFEEALLTGLTQVIIFNGNRQKINRVLRVDLKDKNICVKGSLNGKGIKKESFQEEGESSGRDQLYQKTEAYLKGILSKVSKVPADRIHNQALLEEYGIDSVIIMELMSILDKNFESLSKTLFFEYQTISELADYFIKNQGKQLREVLGFYSKEDVRSYYEEKNNVTRLEEYKISRFFDRVDKETVNEHPQIISDRNEDIAIIGLSGRYPMAKDIEEFWNNLKDGKDCITEIPKERWDHSIYFDEDRDKPGKAYSKWGGFIEDVDKFDPLFFNISPREAEIIDPQERIFLETVWNLLEKSGYTKEVLWSKYQGRIGVFAGAMYHQYHLFDSDKVTESAIAISSYSLIANRVSYFFNFQGPSLAIDTACSSALIAIHMACESLVRGECLMAIAGGVNLSLHPKKYIGLSQGQMIGSHIDSRSFGDGDGYLPSEAVGAVLLKPLSKAINDKDSIIAVIKSTAINHGGHTNGFSVPNPNAQIRLIEDNFLKSGIDARTISYVESAANGSALGDPIEFNALTKVFRKCTSEEEFCAIGSVKSNIGHSEAASGIAQLTKVVLQLQHQQLVPSIKAVPLNPNINFSGTPFYLQRDLQEWKRPIIKDNGKDTEYPRRATVSSFGAGGSNAHLIIEEYIAPEEKTTHISPSVRPLIIIFSARNKERMKAVVEQMLEFIKSQKDISLTDLAYTLQTCREEMESRLAMVVINRDELIQGMRNYLDSVNEKREIESYIPIYRGNPEEDHSDIGSHFLGEAGEALLLKEFLKENNLEKLALYWTKGGKIPWRLLYNGEELHKLLLPTYPFARERYWISELSDQDIVKQAHGKNHEIVASPEYPTEEEIRKYIIRYFSEQMNITMDLLKPDKNMQDYGVNSIIIMKFIRAFKKRFQINITGREILKYQTINSLSAYLANKNENQKNEGYTQNVIINPGKENQGVNKYMDPQIIEALERFTEGRLNLDELCKVVEARSTL